MKKSELYQVAMRCVLACDLAADSKIDIIALLLDDKKSAIWSEDREEEAKKNEAV